MLRVAVLTLPLLLASTLVWAEPKAELIDNPEYTHWKGFEPGTTITHRMVSKTGDSTESRVETTVTLKSKTEKALVLTASMENIITIPGQGERKIATPPTDREVPAKLPKPKGTVESPVKPEVKEGTETIEVLGTKYDCKWHQSTMKMAGTTTVTKSWLSDQVPGRLVKMTSVVTGQINSKSEMTLIKLKKP